MLMVECTKMGLMFCGLERIILISMKKIKKRSAGAVKQERRIRRGVAEINDGYGRMEKEGMSKMERKENC